MTNTPSQVPKALLLDIEGTTTPIDFVFETLFPYARCHLRDFVEAQLQSDQMRHDIEMLFALNEEDRRDSSLNPPRLTGQPGDATLDDVVAYLEWLMDRDSKATPLKSIQGRIWEDGYNSGDLRSDVFDDISRGFDRFRNAGISINIYSSGSVLAQKLLFKSTQYGDLTPFISRYFDTHIGGKKESGSYARISRECDIEPPEMLFVSDIVDELDAAASAGFATRLCIRPGNHPQSNVAGHRIIHSFDELPA